MADTPQNPFMPNDPGRPFNPAVAPAVPPVQAELADMHADTKLAAGMPPDAPPVRTEAEQKELDAKRAEAFKLVDEQAKARLQRADDISGVNAATRDRTLAVQEEIATREKDGAIPGTPAMARRQESIREIVGQTEPDLPHADRLRELAARMHMASPSGIEEIQHELMALAEEMAPMQRPEPATSPKVAA